MFKTSKTPRHNKYNNSRVWNATGSKTTHTLCSWIFSQTLEHFRKPRWVTGVFLSSWVCGRREYCTSQIKSRTFCCSQQNCCRANKSTQTQQTALNINLDALCLCVYERHRKRRKVRDMCPLLSAMHVNLWTPTKTALRPIMHGADRLIPITNAQ